MQPDPPHAVFAGTPVLLFGEMESNSGDRVELTWDGGRMDLDVPSGDAETGEAVRLLRGSRLITDWESRYPSEEAVAPLEKRRQSRVAARLVELSKTYGLASREMSLVAVVKRQAGSARRIAGDTRGAGWHAGGCIDAAILRVVHRAESHTPYAAPFRCLPGNLNADADDDYPAPLMSRRLPLASSPRPNSKAAELKASNTELVDLAAMLEPDGGMPGDTPDVRARRTVAAVFAFVAAGHTLTSGAFRLHVTRLVGFLNSVSVGPDMEACLIERALKVASTGSAPAGRWLELAREPSTDWKQIEEVLT